MRIVVVACALIVSGCAGTSEVSTNAADILEPDQVIKIYDVTPAEALSLGPVSANTCNRPRDVARRRLLTAVQRLGGNGVSQLTCTDEGMSWSCWSSAKCEALALNIPPPPPPKPPAPPAKKRPRR